MKARHPLVVAGAALAVSGLAQAQSSVNLYGIVSIDAVHATGLTTGNVNNLDNGALNNSRIGFKGVEDLGGGLKANFGLESGFNADTGATGGPAANKFFNRGSLVGLSGDFGALTVGRQWNLNDDQMGNYFIYGTYAAFRFTEFDWLSDLLDNSVKYYTPSFGGFQLGLMGAVGEKVLPQTREGLLSYSGGAFNAGLTYHTRKFGSATDKLTSLGANYRMGDVRGRFGYAQATTEIGTPLPKAKTYDFGLDYFVSSALTLTGDYVHRGRDRDAANHVNNTGYFRFIANYALSKRTSVSVNAITLKNSNYSSQAFYGPVAPGATQNLFSLGLTEAF